MRIAQNKRPANWQRDLNGEFWLVTRPNNTVLVFFGRKSMSTIFKNITTSGIDSKIYKCKYDLSKRIKGFRIDKIKEEQKLFHFVGMQFCGNKINTLCNIL